ncbi:30496_t:CDS:2, partial [Gigaspora margarita]
MGIKQSKQNAKVIAVFGSIGAGKTTFLSELKKYFEKQKNEYDIFLIDRTNKDTKIFTKANISNKLQLEYLRKKLKKEEKFNSKYSILIEYSSKTCYERQQKRDREGEKISFEYMEKICLLYKQYDYKLYLDYIIFNTEQIKLKNYYKEF